MSNLGFQTVYRKFRENPQFCVDRAFLSEADADGSNCQTYERSWTLSSVDILALSVSFESDYPGVLRLLASAGRGLPPASGEKVRPLIIGGGAALTLNPEPLAEFFDAIVIGEADAVIRQISQIFLRSRAEGTSTERLLLQLAELNGVYVPRFYEPQYHLAGALAGYESDPRVPRRVERLYMENLDLYPTHTVIRTADTEFGDAFLTEVSRGCEMGCRFCAVGHIYRPLRRRSAAAISQSLDIGLETSKSVGFVGASVSNHPDIVPLVRAVVERGKHAGLSSLMSDKVGEDLAACLVQGGDKSAALAPETADEGLRFRIGKRVLDEEIFDAVSVLVASGILNLKLYFMIGLPGEQDEHIQAAGRFVRVVQERAMEAARALERFVTAPEIVLSVNLFIPKPWTPYQRCALLSLRQARRRLRLLRDVTGSIPNVRMRAESLRASYFQAFLSRGDRRVGRILAEMHRRNEDWRWVVSRRDECLIENIPEPDWFVYRNITETEPLAWEIVDAGIRTEYLDRECRRALTEDCKALIARKQSKRDEVR